ncbi:B3 domain-containing protein [Quillaja saponaria]|uniref:B3 domain-containing protein n=1 Tax=Quillaja saponaria TaxID=32244 RepID=A0AAD7PZ28_QUISA|nr:B3 domain-containing protein [Quillaja saponaria]
MDMLLQVATVAAQKLSQEQSLKRDCKKKLQENPVGENSKTEKKLIIRFKEIKAPITDQPLFLASKKEQGFRLNSAFDDLRNNNNVRNGMVPIFGNETEKEKFDTSLQRTKGSTNSTKGKRPICDIDEDWDSGSEEQRNKKLKGPSSSSCSTKPSYNSKKLKTKKLSMAPNPPPDLPEEFKKKITSLGGTEIRLVIQKPLFQTDLTTGHSRLSIPVKQVRENFLTESERKLLERQEAIEVQLVQPSLEMTSIKLVQWDMHKKTGRSVSSMYVLRTTWNTVVKVNKLEESDVIQIWSFRVEREENGEEQLYMALVIVSKSA